MTLTAVVVIDLDCGLRGTTPCRQLAVQLGNEERLLKWVLNSGKCVVKLTICWLVLVSICFSSYMGEVIK